MDHRNIASFELPSFVGDDSDNAFALIFAPADGEQFMVSMSRAIAAQIAEQLTAALMQLAREGVPTEVPAVPELIVGYSAARTQTNLGPAVAILLEGDRSPQAFYGFQNQTDARRFSALLLAAAESSGPKRAN